MNDHRNRLRREAGFTLAEVVVAAFIMVAGLFALFNLVHHLMRSTHWSTRTTSATQIAQECMESLVGQGFDSATSGSDTVGFYRRAWTVSPVSDGRRSVEVRVVWTYPAGKTNAVVLSSMMSNPKPSTDGLSFMDFPQGDMF